MDDLCGVTHFVGDCVVIGCSIDGVVFFKINDPEKAVLEVEEYKFAITQLAQAALRDVCGKVELDTILSKREEMGKNIKAIVELETKVWGIEIIDLLKIDVEKKVFGRKNPGRTRKKIICFKLVPDGPKLPLQCVFFYSS